MNIESLNEFQAPDSPWTGQTYPSEKMLIPYGTELSRQLLAFYGWYMAWAQDPRKHALSFKYLSLIMRISKLSQRGKISLTVEEESRALNDLNYLREGLYCGSLKQSEILHALEKILLLLTETNPKARLISCVTQLEYLVSSHDPSRSTTDHQEKAKNLLNQIIEHISPFLSDFDAHAIGQGLLHILAHPDEIKEIYPAIRKAASSWLRAS